MCNMMYASVNEFQIKTFLWKGCQTEAMNLSKTFFSLVPMYNCADSLYARTHAHARTHMHTHSQAGTHFLHTHTHTHKHTHTHLTGPPRQGDVWWSEGVVPSPSTLLQLEGGCGVDVRNKRSKCGKCLNSNWCAWEISLSCACLDNVLNVHSTCYKKAFCCCVIPRAGHNSLSLYIYIYLYIYKVHIQYFRMELFK